MTRGSLDALALQLVDVGSDLSDCPDSDDPAETRAAQIRVRRVQQPRRRRPSVETPAHQPEVLRELEAAKTWVSCGFYADSRKGAPRRRAQLEWSFPQDGAGSSRRDFELPADLGLWAVLPEGADAARAASGSTLTAAPPKKPPTFQRIVRNVFVDRPMRRGDPPVCECEPDSGCGATCLNRLVQAECSAKTCPCGEKCTNQRFQRREARGVLEVFWAGGRGFGLRTREPVLQGDLLIEYRGEVISRNTCRERMRSVYAGSHNFYMLAYGQGEVIDGTAKGSNARFINHSCEPNCTTEKWQVGGEFAIGVFALRDLPADTELTYDYCFESFGPTQACLCGAARCRGTLDAPPGGQAAAPARDTRAARGRRRKPARRTPVPVGPSRRRQLQHLYECLKDIVLFRQFLSRSRAFLPRNYRELVRPLLAQLDNQRAQRASGRATAALALDVEGFQGDMLTLFERHVTPSAARRRARGIHAIVAQLLPAAQRRRAAAVEPAIARVAPGKRRCLSSRHAANSASSSVGRSKAGPRDSKRRSGQQTLDGFFGQVE